MELFSSSVQNLPLPKFRLAFLQVMLTLCLVTNGNVQMSDLTFMERTKLERFFQMSGGYILDF